MPRAIDAHTIVARFPTIQRYSVQTKAIQDLALMIASSVKSSHDLECALDGLQPCSYWMLKGMENHGNKN